MQKWILFKKLATRLIHLNRNYENLQARITYTATVPINIIGFRPYRSASTPHKRDVNALPNMNEDPSMDENYLNNFQHMTNKEKLQGKITNLHIQHKSQYLPPFWQHENP